MIKIKTGYSLLLVILSVCWLSCENKRDTNGDLGGMWQMIHCVNQEGKSLYNKRDTTLYFSVRNQLFMFEEEPGGTANYFVSYFDIHADILSFSNILHFPSNRIVTPAALKRYMVPEDGTFRIEALTQERLILSSGDTLRMTFRKY